MEANTSRMVSLNGSNYHVWKGKMEDLFYVKDYYLPVFSTKKPENKTDAEWTILHRQGIINQLAGMGIKFEDEIQGLWLLGTLPDTWETFRTSLSNSAPDGVITMKLAKGSDVIFMALWLLGTLPDTWETFRTSLSNSAPDGVITMELAKGSILNEETRRKSQGSSSQSHVLVIERRGRSQRRGPSNKGNHRSSSSKGKFDDVEYNDDMTELWHKRLGHASEKGVSILSKKNMLSGVHDIKLEKSSRRLYTEDTSVNGLAVRGLERQRFFFCSYRLLRVFDAMHCAIPKDERSKLDVKTKPCVFLGYGQDEFGYRLYDPVQKRLVRSLDVFGDDIQNDEEQGADDVDAQEQPNLDEDVHPELPSYLICQLLLFWQECYAEAMKDEHKKEWFEAMEDEMNSLHENNTFELVKLPKGKRALKNKWVYKLKTEEHTSRLRFSPVVNMGSIRVVLGLAASLDLEVEQMDVKTAFLHGDLDKEIYMEQPEGFQVKGKEGYKFGDDDFIFLLLYVDDILTVGKKFGRIAQLKRDLSKSFSMKDLGPAKQIIGIRIFRDRGAKICSPLSSYGDIEKDGIGFHMPQSVVA
ncbi:putative RNA-directed DNA polymerase [Tanacetum coccineum]